MASKKSNAVAFYSDSCSSGPSLNANLGLESTGSLFCLFVFVCVFWQNNMSKLNLYLLCFLGFQAYLTTMVWVLSVSLAIESISYDNIALGKVRTQQHH